MIHPDHKPYIGLAKRQRVDRAVHILEGLLKGIAIDGRLSPAECRELINWCGDHQDLLGKHPLTELVPKVQAALADGVISAEEQADLLWLCKNLSAGSVYYDHITTDIQILHGMLHGILADGVITDEETKALSDWTEANTHLASVYPFDELDSLLTTVLRDQKVEADERAMLHGFFSDFVSYSLPKRIKDARENAIEKKALRLPGICAVCPAIEFDGQIFCFTGASKRATRTQMADEVVRRQGVLSNSVCCDLNYLVVGAAGNPCWAFSYYGRKVEQAVALRRNGKPLAIVHENDFWDAIADTPAHA